ncbi:MAG: hypothetical protein AAFY41_06945 [Bacteroidota bacterium]
MIRSTAFLLLIVISQKLFSQKLTVQLKHIKDVSAIQISPEHTYFASGSEDGAVKLWDTKSGRLIRTYEGHSKKVNALAFSPKGERFATVSEDNSLKVWDVNSDKLIREFREISISKKAARVKTICFSPGGELIGSESFGEELYPEVKVWDIQSGRLINTYKSEEYFISGNSLASLTGHPKL